jgi:hypothetical protein
MAGNFTISAPLTESLNPEYDKYKNIMTQKLYECSGK